MTHTSDSRRQIKLRPHDTDVISALDTHVQGLGLDPKLLELVKVRSSQLNGCAFCTDMHSADALKAGVPQRQLLALTVWDEAPALFSPQESAVLALTEAVTLIAEGVPAEVIDNMRQFYDDAQIFSWIMAIIAINAWNRVGIATGMQPA